MVAGPTARAAPPLAANTMLPHSLPRRGQTSFRGSTMKSSVLVAGLAALSLAACSTTNPFTGQQQLSNTAGGALIGTGSGAVLGAIVGTATGADPRVAGLLGAGLGGLPRAPIRPLIGP